jgi:uncharacterized protein DUF6398
MNDAKKQARIDEVKALLADFSRQHFASAPDITGYIEKLWEEIGRKRSYVITGGTKEVWASAVVYVIARLNFLFDKASPNYLTTDTICSHFATKKTTVSARAGEIEKACRIRLGHDGLCRPAISDELSFVELSNGMVLPKRMAREMGIL